MGWFLVSLFPILVYPLTASNVPSPNPYPPHPSSLCLYPPSRMPNPVLRLLYDLVCPPIYPTLTPYTGATHPTRDHLDPLDHHLTRRDLILIQTTLVQHSANFRKLATQNIESFSQLNCLNEQFSMLVSLFQQLTSPQ